MALKDENEEPLMIEAYLQGFLKTKSALYGYPQFTSSFVNSTNVLMTYLAGSTWK